jgi:H+/Cl- antiporter ClcA
VALGSSYLVQIGIWGLPGFGVHPLSVPDVPTYSTVAFGDLVAGLVVALVAAGVALVIRQSATVIDRVQQRRPIPVLIGAALTTSIAAIVAVNVVGVSVDEVLFSGQSGMGSLIAETSLIAVIAILVLKAVAYAVALGGGFRGGPIFPATFLGVAVGVMVHLIVPQVSVTATAAAGIAAAAAAMIRLPGTSGLLAMLLLSAGSVAVAPLAIIGAVVGSVARLFVDARMSQSVPASGAADATTPASGRNAT